MSKNSKSGIRRCKEFLLNLSASELKSVKVRIKRQNIPEPDTPQPIYRGLDEPKKLVVHFKTETLRGIFDREDIVVNQEFPEERKRSRSRSSSKEDDHYRERKYRNERRKRTYRSKSRSRSSEIRTRKSRSRDSLRRSRSYSPTKPVKVPGLYIPPKSDYLRYKKRHRSSKSTSPLPSTSKDTGNRSPPIHRKRSRSGSRDRSSSRERKHSRSRSHSTESLRRKYRRSPHRRNHSNSPTRRHKYRYRSRSRSRHRERNFDHDPHCGSHMRCCCRDAEFWVPPMHPPGFQPRGYLNTPMMYPRGFPPMIMPPRMPMMQPYRPRIIQPRTQVNSNISTITLDEKIVEAPGVEEQVVKETSSVSISEVNAEDLKK